MIKLYYSPGACSLAPHIVLKEIGVPYNIVLVSTMDGSTRREGYLKINPKGRVPLLNTGADNITEVPAILLHLALSAPKAGLIDSSVAGLTRTVEWMNWLSTLHASLVAQVWRTERFTDNESMHFEIQEKGRQSLMDVFDQIDAKLAPGPWARSTPL